MLDAIKSFFSTSIRGEEEDRESGPSEEPSELEASRARLAACALLLELAYADDEFTEPERAHLEGAVRRQFGLGEDEAEELLELAQRERVQAVDLFQFTRLIDRHFSVGQKMVLAEAMWGLVYSDGTLAAREDYLIRKISNLLNLKAGYLSRAKNRARGEEGDRGGETGDDREETTGPDG